MEKKKYFFLYVSRYNYSPMFFNKINQLIAVEIRCSETYTFLYFSRCDMNNSALVCCIFVRFDEMRCDVMRFDMVCCGVACCDVLYVAVVCVIAVGRTNQLSFHIK